MYNYNNYNHNQNQQYNYKTQIEQRYDNADKKNFNQNMLSSAPVQSYVNQYNNYNQPSYNQNNSFNYNNSQNFNNVNSGYYPTKNHSTYNYSNSNFNYSNSNFNQNNGFNYNNNQNFNNVNSGYYPTKNHSTYNYSNSNFNQNNGFNYNNNQNFNNMKYSNGYGYAQNMTGFNQNNNIANSFNNNNNNQNYYKNILSSAPVRRNMNMNINNANSQPEDPEILKIEQAMKQHVIRRPNVNYVVNQAEEKEVTKKFIEEYNEKEKEFGNFRFSMFEIYMNLIDNMLVDLEPKEVREKINQNRNYAYRIYPEMMGAKRAVLKNAVKLVYLCMYLVKNTSNSPHLNGGILFTLMNNKFEDLYNNFDKTFFILDENEKNLIKQTMETIGVPIPNQPQQIKNDEYLLGDLKEVILKYELPQEEILEYVQSEEDKIKIKLQISNFLYNRISAILRDSHMLLDHAKIKIEKRIANDFCKIFYLFQKKELNEETVETLNSGLKLILASLYLSLRGNGAEKYNDLLNIIINNKVENLKPNFDLIFKNYSDQNLARYLNYFIKRYKISES